MLQDPKQLVQLEKVNPNMVFFATLTAQYLFLDLNRSKHIRP